VAQVPIYDGPQLEQRALNPVKTREQDASSGLRALAGGLFDVATVANKRLYEEMDTAAKEAELTITSNWLKWDAENRDKFRGKDADKYAPEADKWWNEQKETFGKDLPPLVQRQIGLSLAQKRVVAMDQVQRFSTAEKERHADEMAQANIMTDIQFGVTSGDLASTESRVRQQVAELGARKGWETPQVQEKTAEMLSTMHMAYLDKLPANEALAYFNANRTEFAFNVQGDTERTLKARIEAEQKQAEADAEKAQNKAYEAAAEEALNYYGAAAMPPTSVLLRMKPSDRIRVMGMFEDRARGVEKESRAQAVAKVYDMVARDPAKFMAQNMTTLALEVGPENVAQFASLQREMLDPKKTADVATTAQLLKSYKQSPALVDSDENKVAYEQAVWREFARFKEEKNRMPTYEEKTVIMDSLLIEKTVEDAGWAYFDAGVPVYQLPLADRTKVMGSYDPFTVGQVYTDKDGQRARYLGNDQWEPAP
jgi:hypothetical protein